MGRTGVVVCDGAVVYAPDETTPEERAHAEAIAAAHRGERPEPPTTDDYLDLAAAALGTRTADVQAEVDAECDEYPDAMTVPSVAALRSGSTVRVAARRAIEAIAAQTGEHAWQVAVRMRQRMMAAAAKPAVAIEAPADGGEVGP